MRARVANQHALTNHSICAQAAVETPPESDNEQDRDEANKSAEESDAEGEERESEADTTKKPSSASDEQEHSKDEGSELHEDHAPASTPAEEVNQETSTAATAATAAVAAVTTAAVATAPAAAEQKKSGFLSRMFGRNNKAPETPAKGRPSASHVVEPSQPEPPAVDKADKQDKQAPESMDSLAVGGKESSANQTASATAKADAKDKAVAQNDKPAPASTPPMASPQPSKKPTVRVAGGGNILSKMLLSDLGAILQIAPRKLKSETQAAIKSVNEAVSKGCKDDDTLAAFLRENHQAQKAALLACATRSPARLPQLGMAIVQRLANADALSAEKFSGVGVAIKACAEGMDETTQFRALQVINAAMQHPTLALNSASCLQMMETLLSLNGAKSPIVASAASAALRQALGSMLDLADDLFDQGGKEGMEVVADVIADLVLIANSDKPERLKFKVWMGSAALCTEVIGMAINNHPHVFLKHERLKSTLVDDICPFVIAKLQYTMWTGGRRREQTYRFCQRMFRVAAIILSKFGPTIANEQVGMEIVPSQANILVLMSIMADATKSPDEKPGAERPLWHRQLALEALHLYCAQEGVTEQLRRLFVLCSSEEKELQPVKEVPKMSPPKKQENPPATKEEKQKPAPLDKEKKKKKKKAQTKKESEQESDGAGAEGKNEEEKSEKRHDDEGDGDDLEEGEKAGQDKDDEGGDEKQPREKAAGENGALTDEDDDDDDDDEEEEEGEKEVPAVLDEHDEEHFEENAEIHEQAQLDNDSLDNVLATMLKAVDSSIRAFSVSSEEAQTSPTALLILQGSSAEPQAALLSQAHCYALALHCASTLSRSMAELCGVVVSEDNFQGQYTLKPAPPINDGILKANRDVCMHMIRGFWSPLQQALEATHGVPFTEASLQPFVRYVCACNALHQAGLRDTALRALCNAAISPSGDGSIQNLALCRMLIGLAFELGGALKEGWVPMLEFMQRLDNALTTAGMPPDRAADKAQYKVWQQTFLKAQLARTPSGRVAGDGTVPAEEPAEEQAVDENASVELKDLRAALTLLFKSTKSLPNGALNELIVGINTSAKGSPHAFVSFFMDRMMDAAHYNMHRIEVWVDHAVGLLKMVAEHSFQNVREYAVKCVPRLVAEAFQYVHDEMKGDGKDTNTKEVVRRRLVIRETKAKLLTCFQAMHKSIHVDTKTGVLDGLLQVGFSPVFCLWCVRLRVITFLG